MESLITRFRYLKIISIKTQIIFISLKFKKQKYKNQAKLNGKDLVKKIKMFKLKVLNQK
jgi:predicted RNA-binding protein